MSIIYGILGQLVGGCFWNQITNPFEICCSFKYVKSIDYDVVLNARKSTQVSSENVANMLPIYEFSMRRAGFKIQYPSGCVGSSPTLGTTLKPSSKLMGVFLCYIIQSYPIISNYMLTMGTKTMGTPQNPTNLKD